MVCLQSKFEKNGHTLMTFKLCNTFEKCQKKFKNGRLATSKHHDQDFVQTGVFDKLLGCTNIHSNMKNLALNTLFLSKR